MTNAQLIADAFEAGRMSREPELARHADERSALVFHQTLAERSRSEAEAELEAARQRISDLENELAILRAGAA